MISAEQIRAIERVGSALFELSELWDENLADQFEQLTSQHQAELLTMSLDEMANAWLGWGGLIEDHSDYYAEVIGELEQLRDGLGASDEPERANRVHDAIIWIRTHALTEDHPLAIN